MASGTKTKKHECSCGRSFRHAISLKRHQNVTGCSAVAAATETAAVKEETPIVVAAPVVEDDRTIVITPELVAAWQEQTGFHQRRGSVVDSLPERQAPSAPKVDWKAVAETGREFGSFCEEVGRGAVRSAQSLLLVLGRGALFMGVVVLTGWLMITGVSASDSPSVDEVGRSQLAAQTLVQDFLQNARLGQYSRAQRLLAPGARDSVSTDQLRDMFVSLPLNVSPESWDTQISHDCRTAKVMVHRAGSTEVYTVVMSQAGWGLASVNITD